MYRSGCQSPNGVPNLKGSRQPCRPTLPSPAAIAVRHLRSLAASRISTPAAVSASRAAAPIVAPRERRNATAADPRMATDHHLRTAGATEASGRCSPPRARAVARRHRCHSSPAATSQSTARAAFSSEVVVTDRAVTVAGATRMARRRSLRAPRRAAPDTRREDALVEAAARRLLGAHDVRSLESLVHDLP
jgi:hypothetical protein